MLTRLLPDLFLPLQILIDFIPSYQVVRDGSVDFLQAQGGIELLDGFRGVPSWKATTTESRETPSEPTRGATLGIRPPLDEFMHSPKLNSAAARADQVPLYPRRTVPAIWRAEPRLSMAQIFCFPNLEFCIIRSIRQAKFDAANVTNAREGSSSRYMPPESNVILRLTFVGIILAYSRVSNRRSTSPCHSRSQELHLEIRPIYLARRPD